MCLQIECHPVRLSTLSQNITYSNSTIIDIKLDKFSSKYEVLLCISKNYIVPSLGRLNSKKN